MKKIDEAWEQLRDYEYQIFIEHLDEDKALNFQEYSEDIEKMRDKIKNREFGLSDEEWEEWNKRYDEFNTAVDSRISKKLGFTPTEFNFWKLITSMFMHGGYGHLFWNMWFLWLVGVNIEDEWGRPFFLSFYIISGIIASVVFTMISQSDMPLIGASGAIAGVMGAFAIRHYNSKIHFLFIWLFPPIITTFPIYAGIFLPFWFVQQVFYAFTFSEFSNVAFWAHVGGFGFGAIVVISMRYYGLEEKFLKPLVDETLNIIDTKFSKAVEARSTGDIDIAEKLLLDKLNSGDFDIRTSEELIDLYCSEERIKDASNIAKETLREMRKRDTDIELILSFFESEISRKNLTSELTTYDFYYISELFNQKKMYKKSSTVLVDAYKKYRETNDAPYILMRLIKSLYKSRDKKFFKKAIYELRKRYPEMESKVRAMLKEVNNEP